MSRTIDIRNTAEQDPITKIRFADPNASHALDHRQADVMEKNNGFIKIFESGNGDYVRIWSIEEAENFKKALDKAIQLGWLK